MKITTNQKGIKIEFEGGDTGDEKRLAGNMVDQLLCLLRMFYK